MKYKPQLIGMVVGFLIPFMIIILFDEPWVALAMGIVGLFTGWIVGAMYYKIRNKKRDHRKDLFYSIVFTFLLILGFVYLIFFLLVPSSVSVDNTFIEEGNFSNYDYVTAFPDFKGVDTYYVYSSLSELNKADDKYKARNSFGFSFWKKCSEVFIIEKGDSNDINGTFRNIFEDNLTMIVENICYEKSVHKLSLVKKVKREYEINLNSVQYEPNKSRNRYGLSWEHLYFLIDILMLIYIRKRIRYLKNN